MEGIFYVNQIDTPADGKVIVRIKDEYDLAVSNGGVLLSNAAHKEAQCSSEGFNLHEWIIRSGVVVKLPKNAYKGSYDWMPTDEIKLGDIVFWPIVKFFDYPKLKTPDNDLFMLVDYMDIYARISEGNDLPDPVNGFYVFTRNFEHIKALEFETEKISEWYTLEKKGRDVVYDEDQFNDNRQWKVGSKCLLMVPPIQLESNLKSTFKTDYFLAQKRHILASME